MGKGLFLLFPPFSIIWRVLRKIREDKAEAILVIPHWQTQSWFLAALQMCTATPVIFTSLHLQLPGTKTRHPLYPQLKLISLCVSGDTLKSSQFREQQRKLSLSHGATQLSKDRNQLIKNGKLFVVKGGIDTFLVTISDVRACLTNMFEMGLGYSSICSARSALNCIVCLPGYSGITEHPVLKRFIKGVFNMRPPQPRYSHIWDINVVLNYISNMDPDYSLSLKQISLKLVTLLTLLAIQKVETVPSFTVDNMISTQNYCTFLPSKLLKHSRPSYINKPVTYRVFPHNVNLCPVAVIKNYDNRRSLTLSMPGGGESAPLRFFLHNFKTPGDIEKKLSDFNFTPLTVISRILSITIVVRCCHSNVLFPVCHIIF